MASNEQNNAFSIPVSFFCTSALQLPRMASPRGLSPSERLRFLEELPPLDPGAGAQAGGTGEGGASGVGIKEGGG